MNDEALVDFEGVVRQMLAGHRFFRDTLGVEYIKVAWQIDPFGHSSLTPALFEKMGFEYMVMARIHGGYRVIVTSGNIEGGQKHGVFMEDLRSRGFSRNIYAFIIRSLQHAWLP